jgi:quercetin dioxygenase-like cupin family protein
MDRRALLVAATAFIASHGAAGSDAGNRYRIDPAARGRQSRRVHGGEGAIDVKFFFEPERPGRPALFLQYDLPPGTSEGVHTHGLGRSEGAWDEYYYIVSGSGRMSIDGRDVSVKPGDYVHTPLGVPHGIENTSARETLRVLLTAIARDGAEGAGAP